MPIDVSGQGIAGSGSATEAKQDTQITAEQAIQATAGATTGAAVITDANGTIQQYLRGLVKLAITAGSFLVTATLAAGSAIIGKVGIDQTTPGTTDRVTVGGVTKFLLATGTDNDTSIYASGDLIGGKLTIANAARVAAGSGVIKQVRIIDKAKQNAAMDILFFYQDPSGTTFTDNAAFDLDDADIHKCFGIVKIAASDYSDFADNSVAVKECALAYHQGSGGTSIFAAKISRGTPTYASTLDVELGTGHLLD